LLDKVGLWECRKQKAEKLSRGQKQRLILIRSLLHSPKVLFLDEPTSGLDPSTTAKVHQLLLELRDKGMSIFLTTHDMAEATKLCHQVALLDQGKIVEFGTPAELSMKYYDERQYEVILDDATHVTFDDELAENKGLLKLLAEGRVRTIHSTEPNLEHVFLQVAGRELS
jgi:ABC-2 type transport system ATP-binding protein